MGRGLACCLRFLAYSLRTTLICPSLAVVPPLLADPFQDGPEIDPAPNEGRSHTGDGEARHKHQNG